MLIFALCLDQTFCSAFIGLPCAGPFDQYCFLCGGLQCEANNSSPTQFACADPGEGNTPTTVSPSASVTLTSPTNRPTIAASKSTKSGKISKSAKVTMSPSIANSAKSNKSTKNSGKSIK